MKVVLKKQKTPFVLLNLSDELLSLIQQYNYTYAFEEANKHTKSLKIIKHFWATNLTAIDIITIIQVFVLY